MQRLKVFFYNHKTWIYNLQYMAVSLLVLILVMLVDLRIIEVQAYLPKLFTMSVATAQSVLTTLAGALLTISTFTFSTILVVLNMYASSYSPRVVENFIGMKITLKVLGIYLGGFFYCISALFLMRDRFEGQAVIAGPVAIIYSIFCVFYFVRFVQSVISKFQGVNLISDISDKAKDLIGQELDLRAESDLISASKEGYSLEIVAHESGYLGLVDNQKVINQLKGIGGDFHIERKIGEFIAEDSRLATFYSRDQNIGQLDDQEIKGLESAFILQDSKIADSDYRYNIIKLVEIALRALSPGINDPNTAIHCINKITDLLVPLAKVDQHRIKQASLEQLNIFYTSYKFEEDLYDVFIPLINYAKDDLNVALVMVRSLAVLKYISSSLNERSVDCLLDHLTAKVQARLETDLERDIFERELDLIN